MRQGFIEELLNKWAYWEIIYLDGSVAWPRVSPTGKLLNGDSGGDKVFGSKTPPSNDVADRMGYLISCLKQSFPKLAESLRDYYIRKPGVTLDEIAEWRGISKRRLLENVKTAKVWLDGRVGSDKILQEILECEV